MLLLPTVQKLRRAIVPCLRRRRQCTTSTLLSRVRQERQSVGGSRRPGCLEAPSRSARQGLHNTRRITSDALGRRLRPAFSRKARVPCRPPSVRRMSVPRSLWGSNLLPSSGGFSGHARRSSSRSSRGHRTTLRQRSRHRRFRLVRWGRRAALMALRPREGSGRMSVRARVVCPRVRDSYIFVPKIPVLGARRAPRHAIVTIQVLCASSRAECVWSRCRKAGGPGHI